MVPKCRRSSGKTHAHNADRSDTLANIPVNAFEVVEEARRSYRVSSGAASVADKLTETLAGTQNPYFAMTLFSCFPISATIARCAGSFTAR